MIINHPLLGPRDSEEFVYLGAADLINRPNNWEQDASAEDFYQYQYIRENIAGDHRELWYREQGDQSWLVVTRNTLSHEIINVELAQDVSRGIGRGK
jgi:heterotetrameric sarcosine oxidase delta subunit